MKLVNLLAAGVLFSIPSFAQQAITPQELPTKAKGIGYTPNTTFAYNNNVLAFTAPNSKDSYHQSLYYYDGINPIKELPSTTPNKGILMLFKGSYRNKIYYGSTSNDVSGLYAWDGINSPEKLSDIDINIMHPNSHCFIGNKMYFAYWEQVETNETYVYELNLDTKELRNITDGKIIGGSMAALNGQLYFYDGKDNRNIYCYNPDTRLITTIATGLNDPREDRYSGISSITTLGSSIYMIINSKEQGSELYEYDGTEVRMIMDFAKGKEDGVSSISTHNDKLIFNGSPKGDERYNPYSYDPATKQVSLIKDFAQNSSRGSAVGSYLSVGEHLYFTAYEDATGAQLYKYNDKTQEVTLLTNYKEGDNNLFAPTNTIMWKDRLYFNGFAAFTLDANFATRESRIFSLDPNEKTIAVNTAISTPQVKVYPNPTSGDARIDIQLPRAAKISVTLTDVSGKEVYEHHGMSTALNHSITIPMTQLASGNYIYTITNEAGILLSNGKLTKQ